VNNYYLFFLYLLKKEMDTSNVTTLRNVVNKARSRGRIPQELDADCFQLALDGMKDLSLFSMPYKNVVKITTDSFGRLWLPKDFLMFLAVGVPQNGQMYTFTKNKMIVQSNDNTYAADAVDTTYGEGQDIPLMSVYEYGSSGGSNETYFIIDERKKYIQLSNFTGTEATLHYVSSGVSENPEGVEVPVVAEEALIAFILWMIVQYDPSTHPSVAQQRERLYGEACIDLKHLHSPTMDEIADAFYSTVSSGIKVY
jgi:hypothetical protein